MRPPALFPSKPKPISNPSESTRDVLRGIDETIATSSLQVSAAFDRLLPEGHLTDEEEVRWMRHGAHPMRPWSSLAPDEFATREEHADYTRSLIPREGDGFHPLFHESLPNNVDALAYQYAVCGPEHLHGVRHGYGHNDGGERIEEALRCAEPEVQRAFVALAHYHGEQLGIDVDTSPHEYYWEQLAREREEEVAEHRRRLYEEQRQQVRDYGRRGHTPRGAYPDHIVVDEAAEYRPTP